MFRVHFFLNLNTFSLSQLLTAVVKGVYTNREGVRRCHKKHVKHHTISPRFFFLRKCKNTIIQREAGIWIDFFSILFSSLMRYRWLIIWTSLWRKINHIQRKCMSEQLVTHRQCMLNFVNLGKKAGFINERQFGNTLQNSWYKLLKAAICIT